MNTKNILFICGGAFDGVEKIIEKRRGPKGHRLWRGDSQRKSEDGAAGHCPAGKSSPMTC